MSTIGRVAAAMALCGGLGAAVAAPVQWTVASGGNDHWYEIVTGGIPSVRKTWTDARADALSRTHLGLSGYLATVTSAAENIFLDGLEGPFQTRGGWLGGSDAAVEGEWRWVDGPEAGNLFWLGDATGTATGYANWGRSWPNFEDYLVYNNDSWSSNGNTNFYYVEYSAASTPPGTVPLPGTLSLAGLALAFLGTRPRRRPPTSAR